MTLLLGPEGSAEAGGSSPDLAIALSSGFLDMCVRVLGQRERLCAVSNLNNLTQQPWVQNHLSIAFWGPAL